MNNSTDKEKKEKPNKTKKQGPIRWGTIVVLVSLIGLTATYAALFLDSHIKFAMEKIGTIANKATVNVGSVNSSFFEGSIKIKDIQITDQEKPTFNKFQIGQIFFKLSWDALLRAKIFIENASVENIQTQTLRDEPGELVSVKIKIDVEDIKPDKEQVKKASQAGLEVAKDELKGNILGDLASVMDKSDPMKQLGGLEANNLKSVQKAKELEKELKEKEKLWQQKLSSLSKQDEVKDLNKRLKQIDTKNLKGKNLKKSLKELKSIISDAKTHIKKVTNSGKELSNDINNFKKSIVSIDELTKEDQKALEQKLQIPTLDTKNLANQLFRKFILGKYASYEKYIHQAMKYLPQKKAGGEKVDDTPKRQKGKNFVFSTTTSYPVFSLHKAKITSKSSSGKLAGNIDGTLTDLTTNPMLLGRPTILKIKGGFPHNQIYGVRTSIIIDRTKEDAKDKLSFAIDSHPIENQSLVNQENIKLGLNKAIGAMTASGTIKNGYLNLRIDNQIKKIDYLVNAKSKLMNELLNGVVKDIPIITVTSYLTGNYQTPDISIKSNLANAIQRGLKRQLKAKIDGYRKKLKNIVDSKVGNHKKALTEKYEKIASKQTKQIDKLQNDSKKIQESAQKKITGIGKQKTEKAKKKVKKKVKNLLKKFKF